MSADEGSPPTEVEQLWTRRLRARFPDQTRGIEAGKLERLVRNSLPLCGPLAIEEDKDILRFLGLAVLVTPEQRRSPLIEGVVRRILSNPDWEAGKRLDFLYKHIVGRPVSPDEPDLGPSFVPPAAKG
jgi:hypothetical protein